MTNSLLKRTNENCFLKAMLSLYVMLLTSLSLVNAEDANQIFVPKDLQNNACQRIVSLSPSITDTLDALDLSPKIVGFTQYCKIPEPKKILQSPAIVGGFLEVNAEQLIALKPDIIFNSIETSQKSAQSLQKWGLNVIAFSQTHLSDIRASVQIIADACVVPEQGMAVTLQFDQAIEAIKSNTQNQVNRISHRNVHRKPQALVLYGDDIDVINFSSVYAAGKSFHSDLLTLLGLENAYQGQLSAPLLSQESILAMNPDVIFILKNKVDHSSDMNNDFASITLNAGDFELRGQNVVMKWTRLQNVHAIKNRQVFVIEGRDGVMPSIRIIYLIQMMAALLYGN